MNLVTIITGCILFEGQGVDQTTITELEGIHVMTQEESYDFCDEFYENGGDSLMELTEQTVCEDGYAFELIDKAINETKDKMKLDKLNEAKELLS